MPKRPAPSAPQRKLVPQSPALVLRSGFVSFACRAGDGGALPTRILIAKWGDNEARTAGVTFKVGDETVKRLANEQKRRGWDTVTGDYEHQSVPGHPNYKQDPREHWAMGQVEVVKGKGLYYIPASYTPSGEANAANYPDVSGLFIVDQKTNEVIAVHSVALCMHGMVEGAEFKQAASALLLEQPKQQQISPYLASAEVQAVMDLVRDLLDLPQEATPNDMASALQAAVTIKNQPELMPVIDPEEPDDEEEDEDTAKPAAPAKKSPDNSNTKLTKTMPEDPNKKSATDERIDKLAASVEKLLENQAAQAASQALTAHNAEIETIISAAVAAGKKIPASLRNKDDAGKYVVAASMAKEVLDAIPATEPVQFTTPPHVAASTSTTTGSGSVETEIAASLGLDAEKMKSAKLHIRPAHEDFKAAKAALATPA